LIPVLLLSLIGVLSGLGIEKDDHGLICFLKLDKKDYSRYDCSKYKYITKLNIHKIDLDAVKHLHFDGIKYKELPQVIRQFKNVEKLDLSTDWTGMKVRWIGGFDEWVGYINNVSYSKLRRTGITYEYESPMQDVIVDSMLFDYYAGAIRENNQKQVTYIGPFQMNASSLYDFNIELGDTINAGGYPALIQSVDTVEICGKLRNRYKLNFYQGAISEPYLIEGIGSTAGIIPDYELFESGASLDCYSNVNCECGAVISNTISPESAKIKIEIYPNPASKELVFTSLSGMNRFELNVFDVIGQSILKTSVDQKQKSINCEHWENGSYFLVLKGEGWQETHKVIILN